VDPNWSWAGGGNFWFPHEYIPNENIFDPSGFNPMGRWDYGPWMIPVMLARNPVLPSPTVIPEAFMDTPVVNGTAYPYVTLPPTAVRLRILNACNDRMLNLQLYRADPDHPTEVRMVPAAPNPDHPTWPRDGRDGGVPDPTTAGPDFIQIGNEAGFLAKVAVIPQQPVDFDYSRRSVTFGGVTSKALLLPPAVRADVIVDLSGYQEGDTLILFNDAPAPMPLFDARYDLFTEDPDMTAIGGPPSTPAGFGPNTRTILQIRIGGGAPPQAFDLAALQAILPKAFAVAQTAPWYRNRPQPCMRRHQLSRRLRSKDES
jgi:FtsP/CotA-like multicopper oxidase with cupredoxin domain